MKIKILTDGAADFSAREIEEYNLTVVDMLINFDGEETLTSDADAFWRKLIAGKTARTSQPCRETLVDHFKTAQRDGYALVCVFISSALSGTYETAMAAKAEVGYEHIYIVDSRLAAAAQRLLVLEACRLRAEMTPEQLTAHIEAFKTKIRLYACIDSLKYLARGGRISKSTANIGALIKIKPIITLDENGQVRIAGKTFGLAMAYKALAKLCVNIDETQPVLPIYAYDDKNCNTFLAQTGRTETATPIGPVIGTHIGPGGFGMVFVVR